MKCNSNSRINIVSIFDLAIFCSKLAVAYYKKNTCPVVFKTWKSLMNSFFDIKIQMMKSISTHKPRLGTPFFLCLEVLLVPSNMNCNKYTKIFRNTLITTCQSATQWIIIISIWFIQLTGSLAVRGRFLNGF